MTLCNILPDYIIAKTNPNQLIRDSQIRAKRNTILAFRDLFTPEAHKEVRQLFDSENTFDFPFQPLHEDIQHHSDEPSTHPVLQVFNIIYDHYHDKLERESWNNKNAPVRVFINFGTRYNNAFWDGQNLAFGNGDGRVMNSFLIDDVMAHEYQHAVTDTTAGLIYMNQSGALNEHVSDVAGISIKHLICDVNKKPKNWLLGEGLFSSDLNTRALRDMEFPGTAYNDPVIGRDPQPDHMDKFMDLPEDEDNGGVHVNSGILNRAFVTFVKSTELNAYEEPMKIWYLALLKCNKKTNFDQFARKTVEWSRKVYTTDPYETKKKLIKAWNTVGINV